MLNRCNQKSSLDAYSIIPVAVTTGENLSFTTDYINTGISISHIDGSSTINIHKAGLYRVIVTAVGANTSGAAGDITIQLFRNSVAVPGAISTESSASATDIHTLTIHSLIAVNETCANAGKNSIPLVITNTGVDATYSSIKITIVKEA